VLAERQLARARQALVERDRLLRHHRIALALLTGSPERREVLIAYARRNLEHWRTSRICSDEYIDRWAAILAGNPEEIAIAITSDLDGWGTALRQNSPWNGVLPE
jgi:hypothetical protein